MATEEVKIFFKVEGLDGYITDLGDLKTALGQVDTETKEAVVATEDLTRAAEAGAEASAARMDALEGGVKVLAGSAEIAAGAFALLGDENNEFFKATEKNVLGVIALGQGLVNVTEGYRLLKENTKLATAAQRIMNTVAKANPYVLLATALVAAGAALIIWKMNADDALPPSKKLSEALESYGDPDLQSRIDQTINLIAGLRKSAFGEGETEVQQAINAIAEIEQGIRDSNERQILIQKNFQTIKQELVSMGQSQMVDDVQNFTDEELAGRVAYYTKRKEAQELSTLEEVAFSLLNQTTQLRAEYDFQFSQGVLLESGIEARDKIISDAAQKTKDDKKKTNSAEVNQKKIDDAAALVALRAFNKAAADAKRQAEDDELDAQEQLTEEIYQAGLEERALELRLIEEQYYARLQLAGTNADLIKQVEDQFRVDKKAANDKFNEEDVAAAKDLKDEKIRIAQDEANQRAEVADKAFAVLGDLMFLFQKDDEKNAEKNFNTNKKAGIAQAIVNTALAVGGALTAGGNPLKLATGAQFVEAGIAAIAGAAQVAAISRTTFDGGGEVEGGGGIGGGASATLNYNVGNQQAGGEVGLQNENIGGGAIATQTYVLAGDVTSAQNAAAQIENLARL